VENDLEFIDVGILSLFQIPVEMRKNSGGGDEEKGKG
jgi:hypothetical protein